VKTIKKLMTGLLVLILLTVNMQPALAAEPNYTIGRIAAGGSHSLALKSDGTVWAWGYNGYGQLGDGTTDNRRTPVQVSNLTGVVAIAAGCSYSLALKSDGTVRAWGRNDYGQLGDGTGNDIRSTPVQVSNLTDVVAIAAGNYHSLALKSDGTVWAWGQNNYGQLGDGTMNNERRTPVQVSNLTDVVAIAAGDNHSLALKSDGTVWAWGRNDFGQLGDGTSSNRSTPVQVSNLTGVVAIAAGYYHSLALKSNGTVLAWGDNDYGQLGDGTNSDRRTPVQVSYLTEAVAIAAGYYHSLALKSDGTVRAWGRNYNGQLGDGTYSNRSIPVQVSDLTDVVAIATRDDHSLALKSDGTVWAWGYNYRGQLGDGTRSDRNIPVQVSNLNLGGETLSVPTLSTQIDADNITTIKITVNPGDNGSNVAYYIERATDSAFTQNRKVIANWSTSLTYNDTGLATGTTYYYRVKARSASGYETPWSETVSRTTIPGQVTGLSVSTEVTKWSNTEGRIKVVLTWQKPQGATGFYVDVHDGYTWRAFDVGNVTSWDSSDAKIYPAESVISSYETNTRTADIFLYDKSGLDLRDDPRNLYRSALLSDYNDTQYYMFRVRPYGVNGKEYTGPPAYINSPVTLAKEGAPIVNSVTTVDGSTRVTDTSVDLKISATASGSGLKGIYISDQPNMAGAVFYQWPTQGQNTGTMTVKHEIGYKTGAVALYIKAVNMNDLQSEEAYILNLYAINDITPPVVKPVLNNGDEFATNRNITMTLYAYDDISSVNDLKVRYSFDGINWIPGSGMWEDFTFIKTITVPFEPTDQVEIVRVFVQAKDKAGNIGNGYASIKYVSESKLQEERLKSRQSDDTKKPRIIGLKLKNGGSVSRSNNVEFGFAVEDNVTLPENIQIQVSTNGITWENTGLYKGSITYYFSGSGYKELYIKAIDEAGNYTIENITFFILE